MVSHKHLSNGILCVVLESIVNILQKMLFPKERLVLPDRPAGAIRHDFQCTLTVTTTHFRLGGQQFCKFIANLFANLLQKKFWDNIMATVPLFGSRDVM